jgi:hypothetical protein
MPASVQVDLSRVLASLPENFNPNRWIELPSSVRTIAAFEGLLRGKQWGKQLYVNSLHFLRAGGVVEDTSCLIGDLIEVVTDSGDVKAAAAVAGAGVEQRQVGRQSGSNDSDRHKAPNAQEAEAAPVEGTSAAPTQRGAEAGDTQTATGKTTGDQLGRQQQIRHLSRPERLQAAAEMSISERAQIRADGIPEDAMEDERVLPQMQRLGGRGPPLEVGRPRRCHHCGILKPQVMYHRWMWEREPHRLCVCSLCETHLKCSCCNKCKRPKHFSKTQARRWDGSRRCKRCVAKDAATGKPKAQEAADSLVPAPRGPVGPNRISPLAEEAGEDRTAAHEREAPVGEEEAAADGETAESEGTAAGEAATDDVETAAESGDAAAKGEGSSSRGRSSYR